MKRIIFTLCVVFISCNMIAQEFSTFLYIEDKDGYVDSIEVGYDSSIINFNWYQEYDSVLYGKKYTTDDVLNGIESNTKWVWIGMQFDYFRKSIVAKFDSVADICDIGGNEIHFFIPTKKLPAIIRWDKELFADLQESSITDHITFDCGYGDEDFSYQNYFRYYEDGFMIVPEVASYENSTVWYIDTVPMKHLKLYMAHKVGFRCLLPPDYVIIPEDSIEDKIDLNKTTAYPATKKILYNGRIIIKSRNKYYDVLGVEIKHDDE